MKHWIRSLSLILGMMFLPLGAFAQERGDEDTDETLADGGDDEGMAEASGDEAMDDDEAGEGPNSGSFYFSGAVDWVSAYLFRGITNESEGLLLQPGLEGGWTVFTAESGLNAIDLLFGWWNSLHYDSPSGSNGGGQSDPRAWFEADVYVTLAFTLLDNIGLSGTYTWYTSPNGLFQTAEEISVLLSYDDSGLWENVGILDGLYPSINVGIELDGQADGGTHEGVFLGPSIEPCLSFGDEEAFSFYVTVPLAVGMSLSDYYEYGDGEDGLFGYFDAGVAVGIPLSFIPESFGAWELGGNAHFLLLGSALKEIGGEWDDVTGELVSEAEGTQIYGGAGLSMSY